MTGKEPRRTRSARLAQLSNAASTGGAGYLFEIEVQASFVALMATGGFPTWPIARVKLQARREGFITDDCVVTVGYPETGEHARLLCQSSAGLPSATTAGSLPKC